MRPSIRSAWVLTDGKAGDLVQCLGIAKALGVEPSIRTTAPRRLWQLMMPWGPIDPAEAPHQPQSPIKPPFPDIVIASGRRTVPVLRAIRRATSDTFTVFLKDPRVGSNAAHFIWVPSHDRLKGANVFTTLTSPHALDRNVVLALRHAPDSRVAALKRPRIGVVLGGNDKRRTVSPEDIENLCALIIQLLNEGKNVMVTPSRRTPHDLSDAIISAVRKYNSALSQERFFIWDGSDPNPYQSILANAEALIVTGDSVNMIGEACATGVPVYVYEISGKLGKLKLFIDQFVAEGAVRRWGGELESWTYKPINSTQTIADAILARFQSWRANSTIHKLDR